MDKDKGSTLIGTLALIAVAVLVGILIGIKRDEIIDEIDSMNFNSPVITIHKTKEMKPLSPEKGEAPKTQAGEEKEA